MMILMTLMMMTTSQIEAFSRMNNNAKSSSSFKLNAWSLQRLGQPVGINVDTPTQTEEVTPFSDAQTTGTGVDERKLRHGSSDDSNDWKLISEIDGHFKKQSLLMSLESDSVSNMAKLERIQYAADSEGLLSTSFTSMKPTTLHSAGLMEDWEFDSF